MRKIREILRLHYEGKLRQREIARAANVSQSTVSTYIGRAIQAQLVWPPPADWSEDRLLAALYPPSPAPPRRHDSRPQPDFERVQQQLQAHSELTLELLWEEYREQHPSGYCYSRFCKLYRQWKRAKQVVMRQEHRPGERMFLDWAGAVIPLHLADGSILEAALFVSALGVSSYTYAEALPNKQMENFLKAQIHAFEFYGGCPKLLVEDNTKTGVTRACRYEPDLNPTYQEFAQHYRVGVLPTRVAKPRDNAKAESAVQVVQRWIVMRLRNRVFHSLAELNEAIRDLLVLLNQRPFRKRRDECRASLFERIDRPVLQPLPSEPYDLSQWARARVNIDYHIAFENNYYSVPYTLSGELVDVRVTPATVEIFHKSRRVASHLRLRGQYEARTQPEHRPKSHQAHLKWTPSRIIEWAAKTGPRTAELVDRVMASKPHPEMGYRTCLGLIRLADKYTAPRMEAAAERALLTGALALRQVDSMLATGLDRLPVSPPPERPPSPPHENLRGPEYFG
jgi:transposase